MTERWERYAPLAGVVGVVLGVAAFLMLGSQPGYLDKPAKIAAFVAKDTGRHQAALYVDMLSGIFILWFVAALRAHLRRHEPAAGTGRLSALVLGGAIAAQACFWIADGLLFAGFARAGEDHAINQAVATSLYDAYGAVAFIGGAMALALTLAATAVVAFRYGALPAWLAWPTAVLALLLASPMGFIGVYVSLIWVLVASGWLYRAGTVAAGAMEPPAMTSPPPAPTAA